jgi:tellurite methyltransferase
VRNQSIEFFDKQFEKQVKEGELKLNPFEEIALKYVKGQVLDLGCGLGNLAIEAARLGCSVLALDASSKAIGHISKVATSEHLAIKAREVNLSNYKIIESFDTIVSIGLLMFMEKGQAYQLLNQIQQKVLPGGYAIINVLIEGTTYLEMFDAKEYHLFGSKELQQQFLGWDIKQEKYDSFPAPNNTVKEFITVVVYKP